MHQVLQNVSLITKCDWMLLQKASVIIKCDRLLLQRASVITRCENNYKVRGENILFICCNTIFACVYQVTENLARAGICFQSNFYIFTLLIIIFRNSHSEVFLRKGVLKLCSNLQENTHAEVRFIEIALRHGCSAVNLLHVFRTYFLGTPLGGCFCTL